MKLAVVLLNFNGKKHLENYLPTLKKYTPNADLWLIDNASSDDSLAYVKQYFPAIKIIALQKNEGFAGGYQKGLAQIKADIFCLLNTDVQVSENWTQAPWVFLQSSEENAACMPKILDLKRPDYFEYAGAAGGMIDALGYPFCRGRFLKKCEKDVNQYPQTTAIFWASGACFFVKSKVFWEVGGLDTDFFAHMEEIDLCWRIQNRNYTIGYVADAKIYHLGGGTLSSENPFKTFLNFRNSLFTLLKNGKNFVYLKIFLRLILDGLPVFLFLIQGKFKNAIAILKAHLDFYRNFKKFYQKRKIIQENCKRKKALDGYFKGFFLFFPFFKK